MTDRTLVFTTDHDGAPAVVCNFGMHAGRPATAAEIDRLGLQLIHEVEPVDVVAEERHRFDAERSATVYQIRVELPASIEPVRVPMIAGTVEGWALDCIDERRLVTP